MSSKGHISCHEYLDRRQMAMTQMFRGILGLSILVAQGCCMFSVSYYSFLYTLLTFQMLSLVQDLSASALLICWARKFFVVGELLVNRRVISSTLGLRRLDASSVPSPSADNQNRLQIMLTMSPGEKIVPGENNWSGLCLLCSLKRFMLKINVTP